MEPKSLATVGRQVGQKFAKLVADINHGHYSGSIREILIDQMQKFRLWADNMGLCSYGHHSLDYRCRDAPKVYEYGHQLLTDLRDTLDLIVDEGDLMQSDAETMSHGAEEGFEAMDLVDSHEILEGERFMDDEAPPEHDEPLAEVALANIGDTIDRLYRLSFRIRNPATRLGFSKAKRYRLTTEDGTDLSESVIAIDIQHVDDLMAKHLKMPPEESRNHFLVKRLAKANTTRRQQFGLWRRHRLKVEQQIEGTGWSKNVALHKDSGTTSQSTPDTMSQPTTATKIDASICLDDSQSVFTSSSFTALSREDQGREIVIPRLPDKVRGIDFECPYCYILCPGRISDGSAWKRHVFKDLRPYICTYEYCTEADQQYDSITDWIAHEYYNHKDAMYSSGRNYSDGIRAPQQDDTSRPPGLYGVCREQCPICDEEEPSFSHVAHHLRRIAAFALPKSAILEDDIAPGSQDSRDANLEFDEDPAEGLSESELEDIEDLTCQNQPLTSLPQNHNQQYHPILGPDEQLRSRKQPNQPMNTTNLDFYRVLYDITPENNQPTPGIDLEAKPGDLVTVVGKSAHTGDTSESWLCRAHDGRQGFLPRTHLELVRKGAQPQAQIQDRATNNTLPTLALRRTDPLSSDAVKQLDHSSQTGLSIRDYLSNLDYDGSEQDAGQWSEIFSQQTLFSESLAPSRPDSYDPSQPPDDRVVESQLQDMMKRQKAKQKETTLAQVPSVKRQTIPIDLSFYVQIEPINPDYSYNGQSIRHASGGYWVPPNRTNGLTKGQGHTLLLRWEGGRTTIVPANNLIQGADLNRYIYRAATIFTQYPDTPHLLVVPFDAWIRSVQGYERGWQHITFDHNQVGNSNAFYSYISDLGAEPRIAAPGLPNWIDQLVPAWYDCDPRHASRTQAGLIGQLPLLFALAAFSAPPKSLGVLLSSMQPGKWMHHDLPTGHYAERGMVVTVYLDPLNPQWSTPQLLKGLEDGEFGPFYGP